MTGAVAIVGTDTDVGKTVFAAGLVAAIAGYYWKPVQAGRAPQTDSETVLRLSGIPAARILPEAYTFALAASPHRAAEAEGRQIEPERLGLPPPRPLVVEAAGGLLVPLTRDVLQVDVIRDWRIPVIVCARTSLGTINHSLLTIEALRRRDIQIAGVAFIGEAMADTESTITALGGVVRLGRLPTLAVLDSAHLGAAFAVGFPGVVATVGGVT
jgi:dethiobiotin synthetase